jgi:hypothetical protein
VQKTTQKLPARNIKEESLGIYTISTPICLHTRVIHRKRYAPCDYTYTGRNQGSYTWVLIYNEGPSYNNPRDKKWCQMACAWRHIPVMNWLQAGWQKNYSHTHRRNSEGVSGQVLSGEGHFISSVELLGCRRSHRGSREWLLDTVVCTILISRKFPNSVSQLLLESLGMEHKWFISVPDLIVFYSDSVLFYNPIKFTNKTVIRNPV